MIGVVKIRSPRILATIVGGVLLIVAVAVFASTRHHDTHAVATVSQHTITSRRSVKGASTTTPTASPDTTKTSTDQSAATSGTTQPATAQTSSNGQSAAATTPASTNNSTQPSTPTPTPPAVGANNDCIALDGSSPSGSFDPSTDVLQVPVGGSSMSLCLKTDDGSSLYWGPGYEAYSFNDATPPTDKPAAPQYLVMEYPSSEGTTHYGSYVMVHMHATAAAAAGYSGQAYIAISPVPHAQIVVLTVYYKIVAS